ncbi:tRNA pseudouridine(38-40) synthase TruA [Spirochaetota bacterium]
MNIKCILSYDGTQYSGFQVQKNAVTIQGTIEDALSQITGKHIRITAAGRTDAGVHACGQVINFTLRQVSIPPEKVSLALNAKLPSNIRIRCSERAERSFHARYSAKVRLYVYRIRKWMRGIDTCYSAFDSNYSYMPNFELESIMFYKYLKHIEGIHDFSAFSSIHDTSLVKKREIFLADAVENSNYILIYIYGNSFLRNMVRYIVGNLLFACKHGYPEDYLITLLRKGSKKDTQYVVPPNGLYLEKVFYSEIFGRRPYYIS